MCIYQHRQSAKISSDKVKDKISDIGKNPTSCIPTLNQGRFDLTVHEKPINTETQMYKNWKEKLNKYHL